MKRTMGESIDEDKLDEFYSVLFNAYERILTEKRIDVFGKLDFEIVRKIDGKEQRIAKLKGNKILVDVDAMRLPKKALKYLIAHEIAHSVTRGHTKRFWKIVEIIYPKFQSGRILLIKHGRAHLGLSQSVEDLLI